MNMVFATYAEDEADIKHTMLLAESLREFGGRYATARIWLFLREQSPLLTSPSLDSLAGLNVEIMTSTSPEDARWLPYDGKTFAAGAAEKTAVDRGVRILVWVDPDTIILTEPDGLALAKGISLAYRPVMHNRSGTLYGQPPNDYWSRIYNVLGIADDMLFPMVTPGDRQKINAYFNAGLLAVRPEIGILRAWGEDLRKLYSDGNLAEMCRSNSVHAIFLHQTALVGSILHRLKRSEMVELPETYNYPIFFHQQWEAEGTFEDIRDVVTMRHEGYFQNPDPAWAAKLRAREGVTNWLKAHLGM